MYRLAVCFVVLFSPYALAQENKFLLHTIKSQGNSVNCGVFSPDGTLVLTGCAGTQRNATVRLWVTTYDKVFGKDDAYADVVGVGIHPDGNRLYCASLDGTVKVWTVSNYIEGLGGTNLVKDASILAAAFDPRGKTVATGTHTKAIELRDLERGKPILVFRGHSGDVRSLAYTKDGTRLISGSADKSAKLWSVETGKLLKTFTGVHNSSVVVAISGDGKVVATGSSDTSVAIWNAETGKVTRMIRNLKDGVAGLAFSPDGQWIATGGNDALAQLWEVNTGKLIRTYRGHKSGIRSVAFNADGSQLLTTSLDGTACVWDAKVE